MLPKKVMLIAGEPSGDLLAAELVHAMKEEIALTPDGGAAWEWFGAGGPRLAAAGVELAFDMTQYAVVGLAEALKNYRKFKALFQQLLQLAAIRRPDAIICVDFSGFNRRFAAAVRRRERDQPKAWHPRIIQYVSPQVWASRPKRAEQMARDIDLLLVILPFEKDWYARRVRGLRVEFVGHPIVDRFQPAQSKTAERNVRADPSTTVPTSTSSGPAEHRPTVLLLPGSRAGELKRHLPVMLGSLERIRSAEPRVEARMILPNENLIQMARDLGVPAWLTIDDGPLSGALAQTSVAIASTGTVTLECAFFGVPTVALYKTSWSTYWIGRSIIQVKYLAMPNLLAGEALFPEFIQHAATPDNIATAALSLLHDLSRRRDLQSKLSQVIGTLGPPGANRRAARTIMGLLKEESGSRASNDPDTVV